MVYWSIGKFPKDITLQLLCREIRRGHKPHNDMIGDFPVL